MKYPFALTYNSPSTINNTAYSMYGTSNVLWSDLGFSELHWTCNSLPTTIRTGYILFTKADTGTYEAKTLDAVRYKTKLSQYAAFYNSNTLAIPNTISDTDTDLASAIKNKNIYYAIKYMLAEKSRLDDTYFGTINDLFNSDYCNYIARGGTSSDTQLHIVNNVMCKNDNTVFDGRVVSADIATDEIPELFVIIRGFKFKMKSVITTTFYSASDNTTYKHVVYEYPEYLINKYSDYEEAITCIYSSVASDDTTCKFYYRSYKEKFSNGKEYKPVSNMLNGLHPLCIVHK